MREMPLFLLRTKKVLADTQRAALNRHPIVNVKPVDMVYIDLRKFGEAWAYQCELPGHWIADMSWLLHTPGGKAITI